MKSSYRFSNFNTGGDAGRGIAKISFDACPIYMTNAQMSAIFLPTAPSTFHILNRRKSFLIDQSLNRIYQVG